MIEHIPASERFHHKLGWLNTFHLFSFADYYDPANIQFGTLRVFNDDRIDAHYGFDEHPHANMEIVTIMLEGELTHRDSMGNTKTIRAGEVQRMSAGKGVVHAEKNLAGDPVHLYQLWFFPQQKGIAPSYAQADFSYRIKESGLTPLVSGDAKEGVLLMYADATVYAGRLKSGESLAHDLSPSRGLLLYLTKGELKVQNRLIMPGDQLRITQTNSVQISAEQDSEFLVIEVGEIEI